MKKLILIICLSLFAFSCIQAQTVVPKKCKTCGKPLKECQYKGKHPAPATPSPQKPTPKPPSSSVRMDGNDIVFTLDGTSYRYKMIYVSGGSYQMGAPDSDGEASSLEKPQHSVTVSGFYMGQTEVTQALWRAVMGSEPTENGGWEDKYGCGANYPAYRVSHDDVNTFISRLNSKTGASFRLPTEEEWEFSARGGNSSRGYNYSGNDNLGSVAWYDGNSGRKTHPVTQKQANELGLYDMSGNISEWCSSLYSADYNSARSGSSRVFRGGSWSNDARYCRVWRRFVMTPSYRNLNLGCRLALSR